MARPKRQDDRRRQLNEAAHRALLQSGAGRLQLKAIAQEAALTPAAILYYYPDIDDLVVEVFQDAVSRWHESRAHDIAILHDPVEKLLTMISSGLPNGPDDDEVRLLCELEGGSVRNRAHAGLIETLFERQVDLYVAIFDEGVAQGVFSSELSTLDAARIVVALEDSLSYHILNGHPTLDQRECERLVATSAARLMSYDPATLVQKLAARREQDLQ